FASLAWITSGASSSWSRRKRRRDIGWVGLVGSSCHHSIRQCLERSGPFGPLPRQLGIFLPAAGVGRPLRRPNTDFGMVFIKLLQCRQILCVIALIMLLQCRYQFCLFS